MDRKTIAERLGVPEESLTDKDVRQYASTEAFRQTYGEDMHRKAASEMFGVSEDSVTEEQRRAARSRNFASLYASPLGSLAKGAPKVSDVDRVRMADLVGAAEIVCLACEVPTHQQVPTHQRLEGVLQKVAEHAADCPRAS